MFLSMQRLYSTTLKFLLEVATTKTPWFPRGFAYAEDCISTKIVTQELFLKEQDL